MSDKIKVVFCEPGKVAYEKEIGSKLEDLQTEVGGLIEAYYPFDDANVCIVCNDEGKINGMSPCRGIKTKDGDLVDIIFGQFFICDCSGESFASLPEVKIEEYKKTFLLPEKFFKSANGEIISVKFVPNDYQNSI